MLLLGCNGLNLPGLGGVVVMHVQATTGDKKPGTRIFLIYQAFFKNLINYVPFKLLLSQHPMISRLYNTHKKILPLLVVSKTTTETLVEGFFGFATLNTSLAE